MEHSFQGVHRSESSTLEQLSSVQSLSCVWLFATPWLQHIRLPCPSPTPGACSNSCPLSWWCHPIISSSVAPFSSCLQSFPSLRVFSNESVLCIRRPKYWSFSFSISPSNKYSGLFPLGLTGLISLPSKGLSRVFSRTTVQKHQFFSFLYGPTLTSIHDYWKKTQLWLDRPLLAK